MLCSVLTSKVCVDSAMPFDWRIDGHLMRGSAKVAEDDDLVSVRRIKSEKPCVRLVWPTGVGAQDAEASGRMCCGRLKSVNRIFMVN